MLKKSSTKVHRPFIPVLFIIALFAVIAGVLFLGDVINSIAEDNTSGKLVFEKSPEAFETSDLISGVLILKKTPEIIGTVTSPFVYDGTGPFNDEIPDSTVTEHFYLLPIDTDGDHEPDISALAHSQSKKTISALYKISLMQVVYVTCKKTPLGKVGKLFHFLTNNTDDSDFFFLKLALDTKQDILKTKVF